MRAAASAFLTPLPPRVMSARRSARLSAAGASAAATAAGTPPPPPKRRRRAAPKTSAPPPSPPRDGTRLPPGLVVGVLQRRYKRFLADVELPPPAASTSPVVAHCANTGSMHGLDLASRPSALLSPAPPSSARKLRYSLEALRPPGAAAWVGVNTARPNNVVAAWLAAGAADARAIFGDYTGVRREVVYGADRRSRVDFVLDYSSPALPCYVEVKSVTMPRGPPMQADCDGDGVVAVFPDTVTARGQKHLRELTSLSIAGDARAAVLYFVNRADAVSFAPCARDPEYVRLFADASAAGVRALPLRFDLQVDEAAGEARYVYGGLLPVVACEEEDSEVGKVEPETQKGKGRKKG